jgi:hypothetical protein
MQRIDFEAHFVAKDDVRALKEKIASHNGDQPGISVGERGLGNWLARISRFRMGR